MLEIDGPSQAWFEAPDGTKHVYIVYGILAKTAYECLMAYATWRNIIAEPGFMIVWRKRPELSEGRNDEGGYWKLVLRCAIVPIDYSIPPLATKSECTEITKMY